MAYDDQKRESENVKLEFKRYRVDGLPVCASWYGDEMHGPEFCQFLGSSHFGKERDCMATGDKIYDYPNSCFAAPVKRCPIWNHADDVQPFLD